MKEYHKLVRDKIPEVLDAKKIKYTISIAGEIEFEKKLSEKLQEEVDEFNESKDIEELADILEVVYAFADLKKSNKEEIETIRVKKAKERGSFNQRIILEKTD